MNKLFRKIAGVALGFTMAIGVGVAVSSTSKDVKSVDAVSYAWQKITATSEFVDGTTILITQDAYYLDATTGSSACPGMGSLTLSNNLPTLAANNTYCFTVSGSGSSIKLCKASDTTKWLNTGSKNNGMRINTGSTGNYWTISSAGTNEFYLESNASRYLSRYNTQDFRSYTSTGTNANLVLYKLVEAKTTQTITVDPASKEAYTDESISLTTNASSASWALSNNTCGASLSAASGKTVSVSATSAGSVRVTATASGYTSPYVDLTFSERPTGSYITPEKSSTSGYTGQNETISFSYGNLTGSLSVSSSNTSVVTVESPSYDAGEGTVQFNFVGAGSTTVKFYDGSTQLASVNVTVTASSVSITGMPATKSIGNGATLDLGALITVTPTGSCSSAVTWSTGNSSIAGVTQAGLVTGVGVGSTTITVTPDDYPAGAVSCTVTVANIITATFATGTTDGSGKSTDEQIKAVEGYVIDSNIEFTSIANCYGSTGNALKFGSSSAKGSFTVGLINGKVNSKSAYITKIVVNSIAYGTDSTTLQIAGNDHTLTTSWVDYEEEFEGTSTTTVLIEAKNASKNRFRISSIAVYYDFASELDSVTSSGQTTSFAHDGTFEYGGTLTAHYTGGKADATVTPTEYKYGDSGFNPSTAGTAITIGTTLSVDTHNGKYVSVGYTEDGITKWSALYQITVSYAAVTSVSLSQNSAEIGLNEPFDYTQVTVTVSPNNANKEVAWSVSASTVGDDYVFDESGLLSGDTAGTITLRCSSTADSTKYADLVVTVTADPTAEFTPASVSGYVGKSDDIAFTYGNMSDTSLISITSSNSSIAEVGEFVADAGEGLVTVNFVAAGSTTLSISYNGGSALDTVDVTVSADSVKSVTWSASNIDVFSGDTLSTTGWNVQYEMASGDTGSAANYTIKLGSATVTAGYSFVGADNGKTMHVEYGGVSSSSINVVVTQRINDVYADIIDETEWSHELTAKTWSAVGDQTINGKSWTVAGEDDGTGFAGWDANKGQQFGSGSHPYESLTLSSSDFTGTVSTVKITTSGASSIHATVSISVGGTAFKSSGNESVSISATSTEYTFTGVGSGTITISWANSSSKAIYFKALGVTTQTSSGTTPIANNASHKAAQRAAVTFAQAFNAAMDETVNCTEGLDDAWATCSSAYTSFKSGAAALGETEEAWALNLVKYATRVYSDDSAEACLERMMKTYEICVQKHGKTAFMSDLVTLGAPQVSPLVNIIGENTNSIAIIVIISMVSMTAIGGYFFLRRRKENQ